MCNCKQKIEWDVSVAVDEDSMGQGYDGDLEPGTDTSEWVAYQLIVYKKCSRCGDSEMHDAMGACWVEHNGNAHDLLADTVREYAMVPENAEYEFTWE